MGKIKLVLWKPLHWGWTVHLTDWEVCCLSKRKKRSTGLCSSYMFLSAQKFSLLPLDNWYAMYKMMLFTVGAVSSLVDCWNGLFSCRLFGIRHCIQIFPRYKRHWINIYDKIISVFHGVTSSIESSAVLHCAIRVTETTFISVSHFVTSSVESVEFSALRLRYKIDVGIVQDICSGAVLFQRAKARDGACFVPARKDWDAEWDEYQRNLCL